MLCQIFLWWRWVMRRALQKKHWGHDFRPDRPHTRARRNFCQKFLNFFFQIFWLNVPNFDRKYEKMFFFVFQAKKQSKEEFVKFWRSAEISAWIWTNLSSDDFFFLKTQNFNFQIGVIFAIIYIFLWGWNMFERYLGCFHTCRNFCPNHPQTKIIQPKNWKKSKKMTFFQIWYMAEISAPWQKFLQFWKFWIFLCSQSRCHEIPPINQTLI